MYTPDPYTDLKKGLLIKSIVVPGKIFFPESELVYRMYLKMCHFLLCIRNLISKGKQHKIAIVFHFMGQKQCLCNSV